MKVILIKDVARLGRKSEIKDVPSGHALNFLIPRKLAIIATPEQIQKVREEEKQHASQKEHAHAAFAEVCATLKNKIIHYHTEANAQGNLFKGVSADDIVRHLKDSEGFEVAKSSIHLEHPIKTLGTHIVPIAFDGITGTCTLEIARA